MFVTCEVHIYENEFKMRLDLRELSHRAIYYHMFEKNEPYEKQVTFAIYHILKAGNVFVDVGAHIGWFTLLAAKIVGPQGKVIAIEPEERNCKRLRSNIKLNDINGNVEVTKCAATAENGRVYLYINDDNDGGHALWRVGNHDFNVKSNKNEKKKNVNGRTLDYICQKAQISQIDFLKMDVEGSEMEVLSGASQLLAEDKIKNIITEVNGFALREMGTTEDEMIRILKDFGYDMQVLGKLGTENIYSILFTKDH